MRRHVPRAIVAAVVWAVLGAAEVPALAGGGDMPATRRGASAAAGAYHVVSVANGGSLTGSVRLQPIPDAVPHLNVTTDEAVCGKDLVDPSGIAGPGGEVQWAFVYLKDITAGKAATPHTVTLENHGCLYAPPVQGAIARSQIEIVNGDTTLHNVHGYLGRRTVWNVGLPIKGLKTKMQLPARPGLVEIKCDAHEWMKGWIQVMRHPYFATTNAAGQFSIENIPPGRYMLAAWHPRWGTIEQSVEIDPATDTSVDLVLDGGAPSP